MLDCCHKAFKAFKNIYVYIFPLTLKHSLKKSADVSIWAHGNGVILSHGGGNDCSLWTCHETSMCEQKFLSLQNNKKGWFLNFREFIISKSLDYIFDVFVQVDTRKKAIVVFSVGILPVIIQKDLLCHCFMLLLPVQAHCHQGISSWFTPVWALTLRGVTCLLQGQNKSFLIPHCECQTVFMTKFRGDCNTTTNTKTYRDIVRRKE